MDIHKDSKKGQYFGIILLDYFLAPFGGGLGNFLKCCPMSLPILPDEDNPRAVVMANISARGKDCHDPRRLAELDAGALFLVGAEHVGVVISRQERIHSAASKQLEPSRVVAGVRAESVRVKFSFVLSVAWISDQSPSISYQGSFKMATVPCGS